MTDRSAYGWAVTFPVGQGYHHEGSPTMFTVRRLRSEAIEAFHAVWAIRDETVAHAWKRAYRAGWRAVRVSVTPALGYAR